MESPLALRHADTDADILACYDLMHQLRPALQAPAALLSAVHRQREQGYRLLVCWRGSLPLALAGYRKMDNLIHGSFLYVDDLVTNDADRGQGHGECLLAELRSIGAALQCERLVLDTGVHNRGAQRFYARIGMQNGALHFTQNI
jgi:ribosomal protein S18 acetylase RimI-like enzyme